MREVVGVSSRRLDCPRRCTTQPPQLAGNTLEPFRPGYLELSPETLERLLSADSIEEHYEVEELPFARGKYATVRRCRHRRTGQQYAAKYLKKRRRSTDLRYEILHEVAVLHACAQCPRIVNLYQIFETAHEMILVLELAPGGELQMLLDNDQIPAEKTVKMFMRQILDGLEFLHSINVAHLDIKPQNLVLTGEFPGCDVKLCDFGISRYIGENADIREILGTPDYVAPEVLNYEAISLSTDMWSVGVLLYVLLTGCSPFGGDTKQETFCNISQCRLDFPDDLFEDISDDAQDLMKRLMVKESNMRLTASECLQHPWFQTTDLPKSVPSPVIQADASSISDVLVRTTDPARKIADTAIKRQSSIKRGQEMARKTIECIRGKGEAPPKLQLFTTTPEVSRRTMPGLGNSVQRLSDLCNKENNPMTGTEKPRKHSFNECFHEAGSVREKSRKLSGEKPFENKRQTSMKDLTRRSSVELLVSSIISKKQNSFRESLLRRSDAATESGDEKQTSSATPKTAPGGVSDNNNNGNGKNDCGNDPNEEDKETGSNRRQKLRENLSNLAKKFQEDGDSQRKYQTLHRNSKLFSKTDEEKREEPESPVKKAQPSQTLPIHPIFHSPSDKVFKCRRIFIDDELGSGAAAILIPVNSGQSSMSSISGGSSETSSITSEMSVDSGGDSSSFVSSDDSLDCGTIYKSSWDSAAKSAGGKLWARECKGSFERALSRFNLDQSPEPKTQGPRRYQKNSYGGLIKRSICPSSPILNKIGNLSVGSGIGDCKKYGVQLMQEGSGNLVIIREVRAGRYTKFNEVKCESVQSRIRKLQDHTGKS